MRIPKLKVAFFKQKKDQWCYPASLQILIMTLQGRRVYQGAIARNAGTTKDGTGTPGMLLAAKKAGMPMDMKYNATWSDIERALLSGVPPIISYTEVEDEDAHSSVVVWLSSAHIYLNDPYHGRDYKMRRPEFYRRWKLQNRQILVPKPQVAQKAK